MNLKKSALLSVLILILSFNVFAAEDIPVKSIKIGKDEITMYQDDVYTVDYTVLPSNATNKSVTFESLNPDIVYANPGGRLRSNSRKGTATIRIKSDDGNATKYLTVNVLGYAQGEEILMDNIMITKDGEYLTSYTAMANDTVRLSYKYTPSTVTSKEVKWSSDDSKVAKVNQDGVVTCKKKGTCHITVKAQDGSGCSDRITLHVTEFVRYPTRISFTQSSKKYETGETITFVPSFTPADTTVTKVYYTSIGPAEIDDSGKAVLKDAGEVRFIMYNYLWQQVYETKFNVKYSENHFSDKGIIGKGIKAKKPVLITFNAPISAEGASGQIFVSTDKSGNGKRMETEVKQISPSVISVMPMEGWKKGTNYIFVKEFLSDINGRLLGTNLRYSLEARE